MRTAAQLLLLLLASRLARADVSLPVQRRGGRTFCEFEVFHVEDHRPMAGVPYRLTLPDGKVRRGRVPKSGIVHVTVEHAGACNIDLDLPSGYAIAD